MANSKAGEICAFAKIFSVGRLGNRGVKLSPERVISMKDIPKLIPNGTALPKKIQKAFIRAHGSHTSQLFREPIRDNPEFFYPFYLINEDGGMMQD